MTISLWKTCAILAVIAVTSAFISCGGSNKFAQLPEQDGTPQSGIPGLVMLKDTTGAPTGIRVYWWRDANLDVAGYYLYRDTQPIITADPALRVNGGALIPQPGSDHPSVIFDDLFAASYGLTYYYRATTVDIDGEESDLSAEQRITIAQFSISNFSPSQAKVGQYVYINGNYFGEYNAATDGVFFSGVRNDKGPSALIPSFVQAEVVAWENTRITARVPTGSTVGPIRIICNELPLETSASFTCLSPYILSVSSDPATIGQSFEIYGANFGEPSGLNMLLVDGVAYPGIFRFWAPDHVICTLPPNLMEGLSRIELLIGAETTSHYYCNLIY